MKTLKESLLDNIEDNLAGGEDIAMRLHILKQLRDPNLYYVNQHWSDDELFYIFKNRGRWLVDVKDYITCFCNENGELTDGSFSFNSIKRHFTIGSNDVHSMTPIDCTCKSLKYGPTVVYGDLYITGCPKLKDLKDCPRHVGGEVAINNTGITTLKYFPSTCENVRVVNNKDLKTLKDAKRCNIKKQINIMHNGAEITSDIIRDSKMNVVMDSSYAYQGDDSMLAKLYKG